MTLIALALAAAVSAFSDSFVIDTVFTVPDRARISAAAGWTFWNYCAVSADGRTAYFIDPEKNEISAVDLYRGAATVLVKNGRKKNEVVLPTALSCAPGGQLIVSDLGARRVLTFAGDGALVSSFLAPAGMLPPNEMRALDDGSLLLTGCRFDTAAALNAGLYCHLCTPEGKTVKSFAYTPRAALERYLWIGVTAASDIDDKGNIYACFSTEGEICAYSPEGDTIRTFPNRPPWFVPVPALPRPNFQRESEPLGFWKSWTRIVRLIAVGGDRLLLVGEANGHVPGTAAPFVLSVYGTDGSIRQPGIACDYVPVGRDSANAVYFLTVKGDQILRTHLKEEPTRE